MSRKRILLDLAEILDSPVLRSWLAEHGDRRRRQLELLLTLCYELLGKRPELLDGQDVEALLRRHLPMRLGRRDPLAEDLPQLLRAMIDALEASRHTPFAFEARLAVEAHAEAFDELVESGALAGRSAPPRREGVVHRAPKLGRNDPCFCGSGKKFKKCHGRPD